MGVPPQDDPLSIRDEAAMRFNGKVLIPSFGGGDGIRGAIGGGDICTTLTENHSPLNIDPFDTGYVSSDGAKDRNTGGTIVLVTGGK